MKNESEATLCCPILVLKSSVVNFFDGVIDGCSPARKAMMAQEAGTINASIEM
jgi:hypothetical protein